MCSLEKKSQTGLEWHEGGLMMIVSFGELTVLMMNI